MASRSSRSSRVALSVLLLLLSTTLLPRAAHAAQAYMKSAVEESTVIGTRNRDCWAIDDAAAYVQVPFDTTPACKSVDGIAGTAEDGTRLDATMSLSTMQALGAMQRADRDLCATELWFCIIGNPQMVRGVSNASISLGRASQAQE